MQILAQLNSTQLNSTDKGTESEAESVGGDGMLIVYLIRGREEVLRNRIAELSLESF